MVKVTLKDGSVKEYEGNMEVPQYNHFNKNEYTNKFQKIGIYQRLSFLLDKCTNVLQ